MRIIAKIKKWVIQNNSLRHIAYMVIYTIQYRRNVIKKGFLNKKTQGEKEYKQKWRTLSRFVEPYSYRYFRHYFGDNPNIVPENIGHAIIEETLNPLKFRSVYMDKNFFGTVLGNCGMLPKMVLCRIGGGNLLDSDYRLADLPLSSYLQTKSYILKPSVDSSSGNGVMKFDLSGGGYFSKDGVELTKDFLFEYGNDFCLQETVEQHSFMKSLCSSSINTIRLCVYRSVVTEKPVVTASIIRIGKEGSFIDNAHAGGMFIGVDIKTGQLGKFVCDQYGNKKNIWNDIDYEEKKLVVPNWDAILEFAKNIGSRILHHRILQLDIYLKEDGTPGLIEYNIKSIGYWLYFLIGQSPFGNYTDEIINYCKIRNQ